MVNKKWVGLLWYRKYLLWQSNSAQSYWIIPLFVIVIVIKLFLYLSSFSGNSWEQEFILCNFHSDSYSRYSKQFFFGEQEDRQSRQIAASFLETPRVMASICGSCGWQDPGSFSQYNHYDLAVAFWVALWLMWNSTLCLLHEAVTV